MAKVKLKDLSRKEDLLAGGHRLCAGCGASPIIRQVLLSSDYPVVVAQATGCVEVATSPYPYTSWRVPWIHSAFENAAATISGAESMYRALKKKGKIPQERLIKFIAIGGDGGTYDIGLQSLSGALERGHSFLYICYNNGAYMNTGVQRSSSTPRWTDTTTSPAGSVIPGKQQNAKDLTAIIAAHKIPYLAQASPGYYFDLMEKVKKALSKDGPTFINVLAPCPLGWRFESSESMNLARLGVDSYYWPLYEIEDGITRITYRPKEKKPILEWLKSQGRFRHLLKPDNRHLIDEIQASVDKEWEQLLKKEKYSTVKDQ